MSSFLNLFLVLFAPGYYVNVASGNVSQKETWRVPDFPVGNDPAHFATPPKSEINWLLIQTENFATRFPTGIAFV